MNVLVILEDALRPDHMGCYGYAKNTTPHCDRLAREGVLFESCIAVSAHTVPPIVSLLTGQSPFTHGLMTAGDYAAWKKGSWQNRRTPLRALAEAGYLVDGELIMRWHPLGFTRDQNDLMAYLNENHGRKWFYFAEPYSTHLPYNPPQEYYKEFVDKYFHPSPATRQRLEVVRQKMILHPPDVTSAMEVGQEDAIGQGDAAHQRSYATIEFSPEDIPGILALYDGEVRVFDDFVGQCVRKLEELRLLDDTLIVIVADHGEELLERGHVGHTSCNLKGTLYDESIRVPLILRYPQKLPAGVRVSPQVSQVDLMPTLLELLGMQSPMDADGASLMPLILGRTRTFRAEAYAETPPAGWQALEGDERRIRCVRTDEWKFIEYVDLRSGARREELFNLRQDPCERKSVLSQQPAIAQMLRTNLHRLMKTPKSTRAFLMNGSSR
jgi:arylsulfatase A-like enzyme